MKRTNFLPRFSVVSGVKFFLIASAVFFVFTIASPVYLWPHGIAFAQQAQDDSIAGGWKGRYTEVWKSHGNSVHNGVLEFELEVSGQEVTGLVYKKDDEDQLFDEDEEWMYAVQIEKGSWINGRLEIEWSGTKLTAEMTDNKLVGTYRYYWHIQTGDQYDEWEGSFELSRPAQ